MRPEGVIRKKIEYLEDYCKNMAGWHRGMIDDEILHYKWILFENECPECHHECIEIGGWDEKKDKQYKYYHCENCRWSNYEDIMQKL